MSRAPNVNRPISLSDYLWPQMRTSLFGLLIFLLSITLVVYLGFTVWLKAENLQSHLEAANATVSDAIESGDWEFVLSALKANSSTNEIYNLTLTSPDGKAVYAGPFGGQPLGAGSYCTNSIQKDRLYGCVKILLPTDFLMLVAFALLSVLFTILSFVGLRRRSISVFNSISEFLVEDIENKETNIQEIERVRARVVALIKAKEISANEKALAELGAQVAHDIRSPVSALKMVIAKVHDIDQEKMSIVVGATKRIEDIANKLLERHNHKTIKLKTIPLGYLVQQVTLEKRSLFSNFSNIRIENEIEGDDPLVSVEAEELATILSNLINNSVEAIGNRKGTVRLSTRTGETSSVLSIVDDGPGIPPEQFEKIGRRGFTVGKAGGSGLGLYHAKNKMESWRGQLKIRSEPGKGTCVELHFPSIEIAGRV